MESLYEANQNRTVLLYSGGLDSLCIHSLLRKYGREFDSIYFKHDLKYSLQEQAALYNLRDRWGVDVIMNYTVIESFEELEQPDGFIPLRNHVFASLAAMLGYSTIMLGAVYGESSKDKSQKFYHDFSALVSYLLDRDVRLVAPFSKFTKTELVARALNERAVTEDMLRETWSCYNPHMNSAGKDIHCGKCLACYRRWVALSRNGVEEEYAFDPSKFLVNQIRKNPRKLIENFIRQPAERKVELLKNNTDGLVATLGHKFRRG